MVELSNDDLREFVNNRHYEGTERQAMARELLAARSASKGGAEPVATITELGEVMVPSPSGFKAMFDRMPKAPHGGIKSIEVYAHPPSPTTISDEQVSTPDLQQRLVTALYGPNVRRSDTVEELTDALIAVTATLRAARIRPSEADGEVAAFDKATVQHERET